VTLDSFAVSLPGTLAQRLRRGDPAVMGRLDGDRVLLDLIAVGPQHDDPVLRAVRAASAD
jgi:L-seryl-tRNA(Ser) seleniumtransferase